MEKERLGQKVRNLVRIRFLDCPAQTQWLSRALLR